MESVWVSVWVFRPKTDTVIKKKIPRNLTVSRENLGAAIQIRTGDLILTKDVLYHLSHSSTRVCSLICAIYPRLALQALARLQCNQQTLGDPERARTVDL